MAGAPLKIDVHVPPPPTGIPPVAGEPNPPKAAGMWTRPFSLVRRHLVEPFVRSKHPPWYDARGAAVGAIIGFGFPFGTQLIGMALIRLAFRYNIILAFAVSWISNPFTIIPLYYAYYYAGSLILGRPPMMDPETFHQLVNPILAQSYLWETFELFMALSYDFLVRCVVSAVIVTAIAGIVAYALTLRIQTARCVRRAERAGISYRGLVEDLERRLKEECCETDEPSRDGQFPREVK